jgi:hypothetical protein
MTTSSNAPYCGLSKRALTIGQERDPEIVRRRDATIGSSQERDLHLLDDAAIGLPAASKKVARLGQN